MNHFRVDPEIFARFPGMQLSIAVTDGLDNTATPAGLERYWTEAWESAGTLDVDDARKHPHVDYWRGCFRSQGVSMKRFPTSIEALLRRALKGDAVFRINPLVDFYNALSLKHICPAGAFDLDALTSPIELRFTTEADRFQALDADQPISVTGGEIAYVSARQVLTRHFMWRQSRLALIGARSKRLFLVSEIPGTAGRPVAESMLADMCDGLKRFFDCDCEGFVLSQGDESISWQMR